MSKRKVSVLVRLHMLSGEEVCLQRRIRKYLIFRGWRDWILLNQDVYDIDEKIVKKIEEIEKLLFDRKDAVAFVRDNIKDVNDSYRQTRGYGTPFKMKFKVNKLKIRRKDWTHPVDMSWVKSFSNSFLKENGLKGGGGGGGVQKNTGGNRKNNSGSRESTREKMGLDDIEPRVRSAYIPGEMNNLKFALENMDDFDYVIPFKEDKKKNKGGGGGETNKQRKKRQQQEQQDQDDY